MKQFLKSIEHKLSRKQEKIDYINEMLDEQNEENCPFAPAICNKSREILNRTAYRPIYQRYQKFYEKKQENIDKFKRKREKKKRKEFQDSKKRKMKEMMKSTRFQEEEEQEENQEEVKKSLYDSHMEWMDKRNRKVLKMQMSSVDKNFDDEEETYFKPKINKRSSSSVKLSFFERQEQYKKRKVKNMKRIDKKMHQFPFKPKINSNASKLANSSKKSLRRRKSQAGHSACKNYLSAQKPYRSSYRSAKNSNRSRRSNRSSSRRGMNRSTQDLRMILATESTKGTKDNTLSRGYNTRLYDSPYKHNQVSVVVAKKPRRGSKSPVVVKQRKIVAKLNKKNSRFRKRMRDRSFGVMNDRDRENVVVHTIELDEEVADTLRESGKYLV